MNNAELIAEARQKAWVKTDHALMDRLADALERSERERDILAKGFATAMQELRDAGRCTAPVADWPDWSNYNALREALALIEGDGMGVKE